MSSSGRRLSLSPIGFDLILALSQAPAGFRLAELAQVIGSPVSSVQTALRVLVANDIVLREGIDPPRYRLVPTHPASASLVSTATVIGDAAHAIGVLLRASPAVAWAGVDSAGFLVGLAADPPADALPALDRQLAALAQARPDAPGIERMPLAELERLARVALELRARIRGTVTIKGRAPAAARDAGGQVGRRAG